jgi:hypothetical protein
LRARAGLATRPRLRLRPLALPSSTTRSCSSRPPAETTQPCQPPPLPPGATA